MKTKPTQLTNIENSPLDPDDLDDLAGFEDPGDEPVLPTPAKPPADSDLKIMMISGSDKGGIAKTTAMALIADVLERSKIPYQAFDADADNHTLRDYIPKARLLSIHRSSDIDQIAVLGRDPSLPPILLTDMAGGARHSFAEWIQEVDLETFERCGIRLVCLLAITAEPETFESADRWTGIVRDNADYIIVCSHFRGPVDLTTTFGEEGRRLLKIAGPGSVIDIQGIRQEPIAATWRGIRKLPSAMTEADFVKFNQAPGAALDRMRFQRWVNESSRSIEKVFKHKGFIPAHSVLTPL